MDDDTGITNEVAPSSNPNEKLPNKRQHNPLREYSSSTYQLVLFMITPEAYVSFMEGGRNSVPVGKGVFLIAQSGGIKTEQRAPGFELDHYIDNLKIKAVIDTSTGTATANTDMTFDIIEPYSFRFLTNLKKVRDQVAEASSTPKIDRLSDPTKNIFILGIRFLGYDKDGNVIETSSKIFDRYYDISIRKLTFKLEGRAVTYSIQAVSLPSGIAAGIKRGMINSETTLVGRTIGEVLDQLATKLTNDQAPAKTKPKTTSQASQDDVWLAAPATTPIRKAESGPVLSTTYAIEFRGPGSDIIKNSIIVNKEADPDKSKWSMGIVVNEIANSSKRSVTFRNDTPILQAIGQLISQSSYLEDALNVIIPSDEVPVDSAGYPKSDVSGTKKKVVWYNVTMETMVKAWNPALNDFTFAITYVIQPYLTPMTFSPLITNTTPYYGPIKRYNYWYTGKNSEVLRFSQEFNTGYFSIVLREEDVPVPKSGSSHVSYVANKPQNTDRLGKENKGGQAQASYKSSLYDPGAWINMKMDIMGDPDWLVYDGAPPIAEEEYSSYYGPNGRTINPSGGQVFIEINFFEGVDYQDNGLLDLNKDILLWDYPPGVLEANGAEGVCYMVRQVETTMSGGVFKQTLTGILNPLINTPETEQRPSSSATTAPFDRGTAIADLRRYENAIQQMEDDASASGLTRKAVAADETAREANEAAMRPGSSADDRLRAFKARQEAARANAAAQTASNRRNPLLRR